MHKVSFRFLTVVAGIAAALSGMPLAARAQAAPPTPQTAPPPQVLPQPTYTVTVIETAPLPGVALPLGKIPAPVQTATDRDIEQSGALDLSDFLNRRLNGVHVNEMQGNPFQPDVNYRGYTASPLLGTPQGLSVYMDGVRLNQPFGDVVSWDLIPRIAIASTTLMPGSNPLFGLNTLGGALSIQTKDGRTTPGTTVQATYGSDVRRAVEFEHGGRTAARPALVRRRQPLRRGRLARRLALRRPAVLRQARLAAHDARRLADGGVRQQLADRQRPAGAAAFSTATTPASTPSPTSPTIARRSSISRRGTAVNARADVLGQRLLPQHPHRHAQRRHQRRLARSGALPAERRRAAALAAAGYTGFPTSGANAANTPFPFWRCIGNVAAERRAGREVQRPDQPDADRAAQRRRRRTADAGDDTVGRTSNQFTAGGGLRPQRVGFAQSTELGYLNPDRSVTGVERLRRRRAPAATSTASRTTPASISTGAIQTWSVYATDTLVARRRMAPDAVRPLQPARRFDNRDRIRARRRSGLARRRSRVRPLQSRRRRHVQPARARSTPTSATAKAAARRRRSSSAAPIRTSRASCPTRWPAIRRSIRS